MQKRLQALSITLATLRYRINSTALGITILTSVNNLIARTAIKNAPSKLLLCRHLNKDIKAGVSDDEQGIV